MTPWPNPAPAEPPTVSPLRPHYEAMEDLMPPGFFQDLARDCRQRGLDPADSSVFQHHPAFNAFASLPFYGAMSSMPHMLQAGVALRYHGLRHYVVTPNLFERLVATHLKAVPGDLVRCPLRAFYIEYPPTGMPLTVPGTGDHEFYGAYVIDDHSPPADGIRLLLIGAANENSKHELDDAQLYLTLLRSDINAGLDAAGMVERLLARSTGEKYWSSANNERLPQLVDLIVNTLLYLTSEQADVARFFNEEWADLQRRLGEVRRLGGPKAEKKEDQIRRRMGQLRPFDRYVLGSRIQRALMPEGAGSTERGRKLAMRHIVSGFWRHQAHGPRMSLRKLMWIEPFWRGASFSEVVEGRRVAVTDEPDEG